jgi:hypothetical protein
MGKKIQRTVRTERLTPEEAERLRKLREAVLAERAEVSARYRARKSARRLTAELMTELKDRRAALNLSLEELATRTGMDPAALSRLENLQRENPTVETITRYAAGVGMRVEFRLSEDEEAA